MIIYFANRNLEIQGLAGTSLRDGYIIKSDTKAEDVEAGVASFECEIGFTKENRNALEAMAVAGNYLLRNNGEENEFYTIIDSEVDTKNQEIYIYAEDAGLDLLNEVAGVYEATSSYPIETYINKYILDSGFEIGINEVPDAITRKLSWDGESTVTERLASIATQFGGYEISFSFDIRGMEVVKRYVNIYEKRGKDVAEQLRLDRDIDRIITKKSVANLATAFSCTGGTPEDTESDGEEVPPITLKGYSYDDGDFWVGTDGVLRSRKAVEKWSRFCGVHNYTDYAGHIVRTYSYDTLSQATLCSHAITELKKICDMEVNYEVEISKLPDNIKIGDRVNIVDDAGELYLNSRILLLETSVVDQNCKATLGEHLIKKSGISDTVAGLAAKFAAMANSAERALQIAKNAQATSNEAKNNADNALSEADDALAKAEEAETAAGNATQAATEAQQAANNAQAAVDNVEKDIEDINANVTEINTKANNATQAASEAQTKANEAAQAAAKAEADAADAQAAVVVAQGKAETAITKAEKAESTANTAKTEADNAKAVADAAKLDAEKAQEDIENLGSQLETVSQTMQADYARKTDLTETEANLQSQISQNAAQISSTTSRVQTIDETANNAAELAEAAQAVADAAQKQAADAVADAEAAQKAAEDAATAANAAQSEADTAKNAAAAAQTKADTAAADLAAAQAELENVKADVNSTKEDITKAEQAVATAKEAADKAQADATAAANTAAQAQTKANEASSTATAAQTKADEAAGTAKDAQAKAEAAQGDATSAIETANAAKATAEAAQEVADNAKANATTAQTKADNAAATAQAAQKAADDADAKAAQAASDLETAKNNLADVTSRVDATEEEIAAAEAAVATAQAAADKAKADAATAQSTADTAKANAAAAQTAANNAKTAADNAQKAADDAQKAADAAQDAVDALAVRVTTAETKITQNSEAIQLRATKTEVATTLGGYYTKSETDAAITTKANAITSEVASKYTTIEDFNKLEIGGRNLWVNASPYRHDTPFVWTKTGTDNSTSTFDGNRIYCLLPFKAGDVITVQAKSNLPWSSSHGGSASNNGKAGFWLYLGTLAQVSSGTYTSPVFLAGDNNSKEFVKTYTIPAVNGVTDIYIGFRFNSYSYNSVSLEAHCWDIKMERGNRATDWTPAPEDVEGDVEKLSTRITQTASDLTVEINAAKTSASNAQTTANTANSTANTAKANAATAQSTANTARTEAANAAKTATNYLNFSSSGLVVGDMTASTLGRNVLIDSDSVDIRNGTTVLASFGENLLELGKNSKSATIDLLNGVGRIYAEGNYWENLIIHSENVYLKGSSHYLDTSTQYADSSQSFSNSAYANVNVQSFQGSSENWASGGIRAVHQSTGNEARLAVGAYDTASESGVLLYASSSSGYNQVFLNPNGLTMQVDKVAITADAFTLNNNAIIHAGNYSSYAAPKAHASSATTYGIGTSSNYGHVKLSDSTSSTSAASAGIAATPAAVKAAYDKANHSHPYLSNSPTSIELNLTGALTGCGGFIDFHFNGNTADYTSRIIEEASGVLTITGGLDVKGTLKQNGTAVSLSGHTHSYLPLSGGTVTGATTFSSTLNVTGKIYPASNIVMKNNVGLQFYKSNGTTIIPIAFLNGSNVAFFGGSGTSAAASAVRLQTTNDYLYFQDYSASSTTNPSLFYPNSDAKCALGTAAHRWYRVYAEGGTIQTSDRRQKENIVPLGVSQVSTFAIGRSVDQPDIHSELFDRLQPVQYNFIEGNKRTCYGLIAQDVIEAMAEIGIAENELDLVYHDTDPDPETGEATDTYGIAYENLIALLIHEVQKLKAEVNTLKTTA